MPSVGNQTKVYIAGPYSHPDPVENMHHAIHMGDQVLKAGYCPFIPHLTGTWHMLCPHEYETWLAYDLEWLGVCDVLLRMPGDSSGADKEVVYALKTGKWVIWNFSQLLRDIPTDRHQLLRECPIQSNEIEEPQPQPQKPVPAPNAPLQEPSQKG